MDSEIYFDNSATTRPYDEVNNYMFEINKSHFGNPSSMHTKGIEAEKLIKKARQEIADALSAESREIIFTSGGTESNNLAIRGYLEANPRNGRHIITTKIEHPSVLEVFKNLEGKGYDVDYLDVDIYGRVDVEMLKRIIRSDTTLISVIYVNNEMGAVQPIEDIVRVKNSIKKETVIHVDAVQAFGKMPISPKKTGIDLMSLSSHKIHGPKGVGALYVRRDIRLKPIVYGGGQESLIRSGTENVAGICGFGMAAVITCGEMGKSIEKAAELKSVFIKKISERVEASKVISPEASSPFILNTSFGGVKAEVLLHHLEEKGIFVSTGSACSSRKKIQSYVLQAMGLTSQEIDGAVRFSFSSFNNLDEVEETVRAITEIIPRIRIKKGG